MVEKMSKFIPSASHWGAFKVNVTNNRIHSVRPFERDTNPSPLIESGIDVVHAPNRIRQPMVRSGWLEGDARPFRRGADPFVPISWDEAIDLVSKELEQVRDRHGNASIFGGSYGWASAGRFHHARSQLHRFLNCFGGHTEQATNYSYAAGMTILPHVLGDHTATSGPITSLDSIAANTQLFVSFGGLPFKNTQIEAGGIGDHHVPRWFARMRSANIRVISVSPIRDDVQGLEWLSIRPNTDTALMLGIAYALATEGLADRAFLRRYTVGYERFEAYLLGTVDRQPKSPDWASAISDIPAEVIRALASAMARSRTMINVSWSIQRADHGEQPYWMAVVLAAMLGQIGLPGGGVGFGYSSIGGLGTPRRYYPSPVLPAGRNPAASFIPVARITDALLNPGQPYDFNGARRTYPDIRLIYWAGGNPFHHHQDLNRLLQAWQKPETIIVHEPWWTATARHADIVLPATTTLERNDLAASRDRFILAMKKVIEPVHQSRNDFDIFAALARRLGIGDSFTEGRTEAQWLSHIYDTARSKACSVGVSLPTFEQFWSEGYVEIEQEPMDMLADFRTAPEASPLDTPSGRIELFSERIHAFGYDDCPGHPVWLEPSEWLGQVDRPNDSLHLLTVQPPFRLHSQLDQGRASLDNKIREREPVLIHPDDAAERGITEGDLVKIHNNRGACLAGATLTRNIRRGVIAMATGAWFDPEQAGVPGSLEKHGNPNVLTLDVGTSSLGQGPIAQTCLVRLERFLGEPPPITAFETPPAVERSASMIARRPSEPHR